jgi:hypothetical protein
MKEFSLKEPTIWEASFETVMVCTNRDVALSCLPI